MNKKILVILGSPRKNGNTEILANSFIAGAEAMGNQIQKISLQGMKINGCFGCDYCSRNDGKCVQKDDMNILYDKLAWADIVVFASPLYFFGISAQLKTVVDRLYASLTKPFPVQQGILLLAYGSQDIHEVDLAVAHYQKLLSEGLGWQNGGVITAGGVLQKGDINGHPALLKAKNLGESIQ